MPETTPTRAADLPDNVKSAAFAALERAGSWDEALRALSVAAPLFEARVRAAVAEEIAQVLERLAENYPPDVFPASSDSRDAVGGTAMRHAYAVAARTAREHAAPSAGEGR